MKGRSAGVTLSVIVLFGGCASNQVAEPAAQPSASASKVLEAKKVNRPVLETNPLADPHQRSRVVYSTRLTSDPVAEQKTVNVSAKQAQQKIMNIARDLGPRATGGQPEVALRLVTVSSPDVAVPGGPRLGWVFVWRDAKVEPIGRSNMSPGEREKLSKQRDCISVIVVDAELGVPLLAQEICVPKSTE